MFYSGTQKTVDGPLAAYEEVDVLMQRIQPLEAHVAAAVVPFRSRFDPKVNKQLDKFDAQHSNWRDWSSSWDSW